MCSLCSNCYLQHRARSTQIQTSPFASLPSASSSSPSSSALPSIIFFQFSFPSPHYLARARPVVTKNENSFTHNFSFSLNAAYRHHHPTPIIFTLQTGFHYGVCVCGSLLRLLHHIASPTVRCTFAPLRNDNFPSYPTIFFSTSHHPFAKSGGGGMVLLFISRSESRFSDFAHLAYYRVCGYVFVFLFSVPFGVHFGYFSVSWGCKPPHTHTYTHTHRYLHSFAQYVFTACVCVFLV